MVSGLLTGIVSGRTGVGIANVGIANFGALAQDPLWVTSQDDSTANAIATGDIEVLTGSKSAGTGNSGSLILAIGTSSGGTRGTIKLQDGSQGTAGQVWTSTDTVGSGHWAASGSGANVTLSNLTGPTSINQDLTFASSHAIAIAASGAGTNVAGGNLTFAPGTGTGTGTPGSILIFLPKSTGSSGTTPQSTYNAIDISAVGTTELEIDMFSPDGTVCSMFISGGGSGIAGNSTGVNLSTTAPEFFITQGNQTGTGNAGNIRLQAGNTSNSGIGGKIFLTAGNGGTTGAGGAIAITSGNGGSTSGATGAITIQSANTTSTNVATGNILIGTGTTAGTRGKIQFQDGSQGAASAVFISTDTSGSGSWKTLQKCSYENHAGATINNTGGTIIFPTAIYDANSMYNTGTGIATIAQTGQYFVQAQVRANAVAWTLNANMILYVYQTGSLAKAYSLGYDGAPAAATYVRYVSGSTVVNAVAGDTLHFAVYSDTTATLSTRTDEFDNYFSITQIA